MKILAAQIQIPATPNKQQQLQHVEAVIERLSARAETAQVDLIALPELAVMEYSTPNFNNIEEFSEPLGGPTQQLFARFCQQHQVAVCYGIARKDGDHTYISQVVLDANGDYLTHYDKLHTAEYGDSSEANYFSRGNHLTTFDIGGVRFGLLICYDIRFPELSRRYCRELGVDVLLHPVAFAQDCSFHSWQQFVVSRALENQVYFLSLNRAGSHFGHSIFCPPWVDDSVQTDIMGEDESFMVIEPDAETLRQVREQIPFRKDAFADYSVLAVKQS